ncbi:MAG: hypothetical protein FWG59_05110 [Betaproteobacteria bacterium]|nr:hypothetical protein [Betaproteobacteria bacterium]
MKMLTLALLCVLGCAACAKQMTTLSDGQPGYAVYCDTYRERCLDDIARLCRGKSYMIVTERSREHIPPLGKPPDTGGVFLTFNSRYWMEVRCDPSF